MVFASALPREVVRQYGADFRYHLIGYGPYPVTDWRRDVRLRFGRNPHYSGTDGCVDAVEMMFGGDVSLRVMMIERGEIDRTKADAVSALRHGRVPRLRSWLHRVSSVNTGYLSLNNEMKPFADRRVRQAMNHAINKRRLTKLAGGLAVAADGIVPPSMPWINPGRLSDEHSPEKTRALLREAGLPDGFKTGLWFINTRTIDKRRAEGMQQELRAVGIEVRLEGISQSAFEVKVRSRGQVACGIWSWSQDYPDPSNFLDVLLSGDRITDQDCNNLAFYSNPEVNRRLALAGDSFDPEERLRLFRETESLVMRDASWVPLYHEFEHPGPRGSRAVLRHGTTGGRSHPDPTAGDRRLVRHRHRPVDAPGGAFGRADCQIQRVVVRPLRAGAGHALPLAAGLLARAHVSVLACLQAGLVSGGGLSGHHPSVRAHQHARALVFDEPLRFDVLVDGCLLLELKWVENILPIHKAQLLSYMKLLDVPIGLVINFHALKLVDGISRMILPGANQ